MITETGRVVGIEDKDCGLKPFDAVPVAAARPKRACVQGLMNSSLMVAEIIAGLTKVRVCR